MKVAHAGRMLKCTARAIPSIVLATATLLLFACSDTPDAEDTLAYESAVSAPDPRAALRDHTFHIAASAVAPIAYEGQGGALVLRLPYAPVKPVFSDLMRTIANPKLKSRGEAHVTVLTPAEASSTGLSIATLIQTAAAANPVNDLTLRCMGVGVVDSKPGLQTFYLVASSPSLLAVRAAIARRAGKRLDSAGYFPHVTVGFTVRDLFPESDGIKDKGVPTCPNATGLVVD